MKKVKEGIPNSQKINYLLINQLINTFIKRLFLAKI